MLQCRDVTNVFRLLDVLTKVMLLESSGKHQTEAGEARYLCVVSGKATWLRVLGVGVVDIAAMKTGRRSYRYMG